LSEGVASLMGRRNDLTRATVFVPAMYVLTARFGIHPGPRPSVRTRETERRSCSSTRTATSYRRGESFGMVSAMAKENGLLDNLRRVQDAVRKAVAQ
jgi:hypothetical protein